MLPSEKSGRPGCWEGSRRRKAREEVSDAGVVSAERTCLGDASAGDGSRVGKERFQLACRPGEEIF